MSEINIDYEEITDYDDIIDNDDITDYEDVTDNYLQPVGVGKCIIACFKSKLCLGALFKSNYYFQINKYPRPGPKTYIKITLDNTIDAT
jgi:hypothetical protein